MTGDFSWLSGILSFLWGGAFIVLLLGGSIFVHELGHFLAARWRGMKVDRFSIGFGPKIFGWTGQDGVEYRLSWIPLGGYVALPQLIDMSSVEGEVPAESRNLPPVGYLDKMIVVCAGVVFNLLLALVIAVALWGIGREVPAASQTQVVGYVIPTLGELRAGKQQRELALLRGPNTPKPDNTPAPAAGKIIPGDRITAVDGKSVKNFDELSEAIAFSSGRDAAGHPKVTLTVERDGKVQDIDLLPALVDTNKRSGDAIREIGLLPAQDMVVDDVESRSPALWLHKDDVVKLVNGRKLYSYPQLNDLIDTAAGAPVTFTLERGGKPLEFAIQPVPIPQTTPLATISLPDLSATVQNKPVVATLDILPLYALDEKGDRASATTTAQNLLIWNVENLGGVFGRLHTGDYLRKVNGQPMNSVQQVVDALKSTPPGQRATLTYDSQDTHSSASLELPADFAATVTPSVRTLRIGAYFRPQTTVLHATPLEQFRSAFGQIFGMLRSLFNPQSDIGIGQLAGPIGISRIIYQFSMQDIRLALWFVFIINVNLAIINLLPIPLLDGGHILFYTIERLRRRALPLNVMATAQAVCLVLLLGVAAFVFFNDSRRWVGDSESSSAARRYQVYLLGPDEVKFPGTSGAPASAKP